jgi:hypothetical protein
LERRRNSERTITSACYFTAITTRLVFSDSPATMIGAFQPLLGTGPRKNRSVVAPSTHVVDSVPSILSRTSASLEYASLRHTGHCPLGMYIIPSATNLLVWDAVFFVHQGELKPTFSILTKFVRFASGYSTDSILKFRLTFPGNYPESPPNVTFLTDVFHPLISSTGVFNLSPRFRPWR